MLDCKWIHKMDAVICPACGSKFEYFWNQTERFKYCPSCGVKLMNKTKPAADNSVMEDDGR